MINWVKYLLSVERLKDREYEYLFDDSSNELVSLDLETTGLNPKKDEILSIGAVKIRENEILLNESLEIFVKPTKKIDKRSIEIHHIRPCDLDSAIDVKEAIKRLLNFIGGRKLVGYYIDFDHKMISKYTKQMIGCKLPNKTIELSSMYYKRKRKTSAYEFVDLKFDTILKELDLPRLYKHDALNDAIMSAMIYLKLKDIPIYKGAYS